MAEIRKCSNCKNRYFYSWDGIDSCMWGAEAVTEEEEIAEAAKCRQYEFGTPECLQDDDDYCPCSSNRDYGPSNPWDAPGVNDHVPKGARLLTHAAR